MTCNAIRLREFCESLLSEKENNGSQDSSFPELQGIIQATVKVNFRSCALILVGYSRKNTVLLGNFLVES